MKLLMLLSYYPQYLSYFYGKYPSLVNLPFEEHKKKIYEDYFGWEAGLSNYMNQQGIESEFVIVNAESLQKRWALENNFKSYSPENWDKEIAMEQIRHFRPDVLWVDSVFDYYGKFVKEALAYCKRAVTWISCPTPKWVDISGFTTLLTTNPKTLKDQQHLLESIIVTQPVFNPEILSKIGPIEKRYNLTFVGQISTDHLKRAEILAFLIKNGIEIKIFGLLNERQPLGKWKRLMEVGWNLKRRRFREAAGCLRPRFTRGNYRRDLEIIKTVYQAPAFGLDMYRILAASRLTLNIHVDVAGSHVGNMRMFEATGAGSCLLTEHSENINQLFEPGKEVLTYRSKQELLEIIQTIPSQSEKIGQVAQAGQKRTLRDHTLERLFNEIKPALSI